MVFYPLFILQKLNRAGLRHFLWIVHIRFCVEIFQKYQFSWTKLTKKIYKPVRQFLFFCKDRIFRIFSFENIFYAISGISVEYGWIIIENLKKYQLREDSFHSHLERIIPAFVWLKFIHFLSKEQPNCLTSIVVMK